MLEEIAGLGFEYAELSHGIRLSLVPGIVNAVRDRVIKISSLHNFCPLPPSVRHAAPNLYQPTACDERERSLWVKHTCKTIDFARQLEAECVVLHGGSVDFFWDRPLRKMLRYRRGKDQEQLATDPHYAELVERAKMKVFQKSRPRMDILARSLARVIPYAQEAGIRLGIENRDGLKELPMDRDYASLLDSFADTQTLFYWHDTGHSKIKEVLGLANQVAQLESMEGRTLGFHIKDARNDGTENLAIGEGELDFNVIARYFRPEQVITLEVAPTLETSQIVSSLRNLNQIVMNAPSLQ